MPFTYTIIHTCTTTEAGSGVVRTATRYGLEAAGIDLKGGGSKFCAPVQTGSKAHPLSFIMGTAAHTRE
jgi:hypothetical protein